MDMSPSRAEVDERRFPLSKSRLASSALIGVVPSRLREIDTSSSTNTQLPPNHRTSFPLPNLSINPQSIAMPPLPCPSLFSSPFHLPRTSLHRAFTTTPSRSTAKVTLIGRLAAEPELIPTASGTDMVRYAVGTQSGPSSNRQTSWWKVGAFPPEGPQRDALLRLGKG